MRRQGDVEQMYKKAGFIFVRQGKHQTWRCPCGHKQLTVASSIGNGHGYENARQQLARALKGCTTREVAA